MRPSTEAVASSTSSCYVQARRIIKLATPLAFLAVLLTLYYGGSGIGYGNLWNTLFFATLYCVNCYITGQIDFRGFFVAVLRGMVFSTALAAILTFSPDLYSEISRAIRPAHPPSTPLAAETSSESLSSLVPVPPSPAQALQHRTNLPASPLSSMTPARTLHSAKAPELPPYAINKPGSGPQAGKLRTRRYVANDAEKEN